jgi:alpha-beta hydrolase superfamily lysophospholipase
MKSNQFGIQTNDGLELKTETWSSNTPKAVILLVHGFSEHYNRYPHVINFFTEKGFAFWAYDRRGHGHSEGAKGHMPSIEAELDDIQLQVDKAKSEYPDTPIFVYGHSQGGNLALNYVLRRKPNIQGAVITSPWLRLVEEPPNAIKSIGGFLSKFLPSFQIKQKITSLSRDPEVDKKYAADPLVHLLISLKGAKETIDAANWLLNYKQPIELPMLLMHGTGDLVTDWTASQTFFENTGKSIDFELWEDWYHEIHNEIDKEKMLRYMSDWLNGQVARLKHQQG